MKKRIVHFFFRFTCADMVYAAVVLLLIAFAFAGLLWVLSSCSAMHKTSSDIQNNSAVKKNDSSSVKKSESKEKSQYDWFRETLMIGGKKDTSVQKETLLQPINNNYTQPVVYIREGGSGKTESWHFNSDSFKLVILDSLNKDKKVEKSETKTELLSPMQLFFIAIILMIILKFIPSFKISRS